MDPPRPTNLKAKRRESTLARKSPLILGCEKCPNTVALDFDGLLNVWDDGDDAYAVIDGSASIPLGWRRDDDEEVVCPKHFPTERTQDGDN